MQSDAVIYTRYESLSVQPFLTEPENKSQIL